MSDLILHHYPTSPFAEKARLMLGFKKLAWKSVFIPVVMPKPDLMALTGGYRRTPVLQIGADIYCDTALIADMLERIAPEPTLFPAATAGAARVVAQWADASLFWSMVPFTMQPAGVPHVFAGMSEEQVKGFAADRAAFRGNAPRMSLGDLKGHLLNYVAWIDGMLADGRAYVLGNQLTIADLSLYHPLWFVHRAPPVVEMLNPSPAITAWMARVATIGQGTPSRLRAEEAVTVAALAAPAPSIGFEGDCHGCKPGERVAVMPTDTGLDPVEGELAGSAANQISVRRHDPRSGEVVVHFPRVGFQLKRLDRG